MAKADEKKKEEEPKEAAPPPKSKKKLIIIIVAVVVLLGGGGGAAAVLMGGSSKPAEGEEGKAAEGAKEEHAQAHYILAKFDPFIVNLSESTSFLKVGILVEYDPEVMSRVGGGHGEGGGGGYGGGGSGGKEAENSLALPPAMKGKEPMLRDGIIRILSSKKSSDVLTVEGKDKLKEELLETINEIIGLEESPVVNIYFTEFLIQ